MSGSGTDWLPYPGTGSGGGSGGGGSDVPQVPLLQSALGASFGVPQLDANALIQPASLVIGSASNKGHTMQLLGDSRGQNGNQYAPTDPVSPGILKGLQNPLAWAEIYSGGKLSWDPATGPYNATAVVGAIIGWKIVNGGSGYTAPTLAVAPAAGHAATLVVTNGVITGVNITAFGAKPNSNVLQNVGYVITDATGTGAVLTPVLNGSGTYSVSGSVLAELNVRLDDIINEVYAPKPQFLIVIGGTNAFGSVVNGSTTLRAQLNLAMLIIQRASNAGMHVVYINENPKSLAAYGGGASGTNAALVNDSFIRCMQKMADLDPAFNPFGIAFDLVDVSRDMIDGSASNGSNRTLSTLDGLHVTPWGAQQQGYGIEQVLRRYYKVSASSNYSTLMFDATFNPLGSLIHQLEGTTGTVTTPVTGTAPTGWTLLAPVNGSGTGTVVSAVALPTDAAPGSDGEVLPAWTWTLALNPNGSATGSIAAVFGSTLPGLAVGDVLEASVEIATAGITNLVSASVLMQDGTTVTKYDGETGAYMAPVFDAKVGTLPPSGAVSPSRLSVRYKVTAQTIATNNIKMQLQLFFDASASPASAVLGVAPGVVGAVTFRNPQVCKLNSSLVV